MSHVDSDGAGGRHDRAAIDENSVPGETLIAQLYEELKQLASARLASERGGHTLTATALVHETYLRMANEREAWPGKRLFFFAAADAMRRVLVDHARRRNAIKRGGGLAADRLEEESAAPFVEPDGALDVESLSRHLDQLRLVDAAGHQVIMLRYFAGLSAEDTAALLGVDRRTVTRRWNAARAWLLERMGCDEDGPGEAT